MKICIIVPFIGSKNMVPIWAVGENKVDFINDFEAAARCSMSFAATEIKTYLEKVIYDIEIEFDNSIYTCDYIIELNVTDYSSRSDEFTIENTGSHIKITGKGRTGILYGAYELLRMQGIRWYMPGDDGDIIPPMTAIFKIDVTKKAYKPSMDLGRGFDFEGPLKDSRELWLWMARNRLNMATYRHNTGSYQRKLGMSFKAGGHIFEHILKPDHMMKSGKSLWDDHEDWYGLPIDKIRIKEKALSTQFCVTNISLVAFLTDELLSFLNNEWKEADRIDVWGFDTWGNTCTCEKCEELGNSTDQTLYFISQLRKHIDLALKENRISHNVALVMCSYEGTSTIKPPVNKIPENIANSGDYIVYYPIKRCYAHTFFDKECPTNSFYNEALTGWNKLGSKIPVMFGEYYNVTKFEDLPILFSSTIVKDIPYYHSIGVRGMTYMHLPLINWGIRTITQLLYAQLNWDVTTDTDAFINEYFKNWYGKYSDDMKNVLELTENAFNLLSSWRAWGEQSILSALLFWDGDIPKQPLKVESHFKSPSDAIEKGYGSVEKLRNALEILVMLLTEERDDISKNSVHRGGVLVNPYDMQFCNKSSQMETRLAEARRQLIYGIDTMEIMTMFVEYHNALYENEVVFADELFEEIEVLCDNMDCYYMPIRFYHPDVGLASYDAFTRTQLKGLLYCIKNHRQNKGENNV